MRFAARAIGSCFLVLGCGLPTSGTGSNDLVWPSEAAVAFTGCGEGSIPSDPPGRPGAVLSNLQSDPGADAAYDGETGYTVSCAITPTGDSFEVNASVQVARRYFERFGAAGTVATGGGSLDLDFGNLGKGHCAVSIVKGEGVVKNGALWARFQCDAFPLADDGGLCTMSGAFLFENCGGTWSKVE